MSRLLDLVFQKRGYDQSFLQELNTDLRQDFFALDSFLRVLYDLRESQETLVILPDFDMDGIMSGVLGMAGLSELGFHVELYVPSPLLGYGVSKEVISDLVSKHPTVHTILTCDTGITSFEGISYAKSLGLSVLVTDHHQVQETLPEADVVVDPFRKEDSYPLKGICGAHVLWQTLFRFAETFGTKEEILQIERLRVFAGIGTISDLMPVQHENRKLISDTVFFCRLLLATEDSSDSFVSSLSGCIFYRRAFHGLATVLRLFSQYGKIPLPDTLNEEFFGFYFAPMFNSIKRLGGDVFLAFSVFFSENPMEYAEKLYQMNEERKLLVARYFTAMMGQENPYAPYIYLTDAPSGLLGLLAAKRMSESHLPTFVLRGDSLLGFHGSGRSPEWFPAQSYLRPLGFSLAGHEGAFGCSFPDTFDLLRLVTTLDAVLPSLVTTPDKMVLPFDYILDTKGVYGEGIDLDDCSLFLSECEDLRPFGIGFPHPEGLLVVQKDGYSRFSVTTMGSMKQHVKVTLPYGFEVLLWNQADQVDFLQQAPFFTIAGTLGRNSFMGRETIQFMGKVMEYTKEEISEGVHADVY